MLLLQPSRVVPGFCTLGGEGNVAWGVARLIPAGARVGTVSLHLLLGRPLVQYVRLVARGGAVVVFLSQQLR